MSNWTREGRMSPDERADSPDSAPETPDETIDNELPRSPETPDSDGPTSLSTPLDSYPFGGPRSNPKRVPSLRSVSDPRNIHPTSTPLGTLNNARRPGPSAPNSGGFGGAPGRGAGSDVMFRARSLLQTRSAMSSSPPSISTEFGSRSSPVPGIKATMSRGLAMPSPVGPLSGFSGMRLPGSATRHGGASSPITPVSQGPKGGLSARRGMKLSMSSGGPSSPALSSVSSTQSSASDGTGTSPQQAGPALGTSKMDDFKQYIDADKGWITFEGAATITDSGVNFANGQTFKISLDEIEPLGELGKGNYGTVYKVRHAKRKVPRFGQGLSNAKAAKAPLLHTVSDPSPVRLSDESASAAGAVGKTATTGVIMAMKEIRLELEEAKFATILKELVILHECVSPYIIDFYGAFFQEGAVYMCIEYMDGGSLDKLYAGGIPESVLRKVAYSAIMGLKSLKEEHSIIHRDVKPTNILVNTRGQVKICDFGVSGNLVASMAKTNIGCQSYMAPERITGGGLALGGGSYNVQSDIWSLGLTIIECALGQYPYPPDVASTIFSQLSAIVEGNPPDLPKDRYSVVAQQFVSGCLNKKPQLRPTYGMLLNHPWMAASTIPETIDEEDEEEGSGDAVATTTSLFESLKIDTGAGDAEVAAWAKAALERAAAQPSGQGPHKPALHRAPLDAVSPATSPLIGSGNTTNLWGVSGSDSGKQGSSTD